MCNFEKKKNSEIDAFILGGDSYRLFRAFGTPYCLI